MSMVIFDRIERDQILMWVTDQNQALATCAAHLANAYAQIDTLRVASALVEPSAMKTQAEIEARLKEHSAYMDKYGRKPASVSINAPRALMQCDQEATERELKWVLGLLVDTLPTQVKP